MQRLLFQSNSLINFNVECSLALPYTLEVCSPMCYRRQACRYVFQHWRQVYHVFVRHNATLINLHKTKPISHLLHNFHIFQARHISFVHFQPLSPENLIFEYLNQQAVLAVCKKIYHTYIRYFCKLQTGKYSPQTVKQQYKLIQV